MTASQRRGPRRARLRGGVESGPVIVMGFASLNTSEPAGSSGGVSALDHHVLDDAAAGTSECRRCLILRGFEAGDALHEGGELDHDEAMEVVRSFVDVIPAAARQDPAAVLGDDWRHEVRALLVLHGIRDLLTEDEFKATVERVLQKAPV